MVKKLITMWAKGSGLCIVFLVIWAIFDPSNSPIVSAYSTTMNWILSYLVAVTPVGAVIGYIVLFLFKFVWHLIFGSDDSSSDVDYETSSHDRSYGSCPYASTINFEEDTQLFGQTWKKNSSELRINEDWTISEHPFGSRLGWVDNRGTINNDEGFGDIDPSKRSYMADTGYKIQGRKIYKGSKRVASLS